jgi:hypothetical protein
MFASDATGETEFVLFDRVAAGAVGKPLMTLMRRKYPGHVTEEDIANIARHDMDVPSEITCLIGLKFKFLVSISKKWKSTNSTNIEELSFQVNRIEDTYKPELPPLDFDVASGSGGASPSAGGSRPQIPPLGPSTSPAPRTPATLRSNPHKAIRAGYGSPVSKVCF